MASDLRDCRKQASCLAAWLSSASEGKFCRLELGDFVLTKVSPKSGTEPRLWKINGLTDDKYMNEGMDARIDGHCTDGGIDDGRMNGWMNRSIVRNGCMAI